MKKLLIFVLMPMASFAQKMPDIGVSKVRLIETDKTILAEINPVSKNITAQSDKLYFWYGSNKIHITQGGYSDRLLNGNYTEYYLNKNLKEQGSFKKGLKDGIWKNWNNLGILTQELRWKKGTLYGTFKIYNEDGRLKQQGNYQDNLLQGAVITYMGKDSGRIVFYNHGQASAKPPSFWSKINFLKKGG